jgi:outer membrane receptor protein involved in Fe transport
MKNLYLLLFVFSSLTISSQVTISGSVKDPQGATLPFCSIALLNAQDSSLVKGAISDENGTYTINEVKAGIYMILGSFTGYKDLYSKTFELKPENKSATVDLSFPEETILLNEVAIVAKKPFLEQKADRLVVNVASSALAAGGTVSEIIAKVPGVVMVQDRITLGGSQNLSIFIDGKPSNYPDINAVLRDMPGDQIEKIELITQPGAQFDAAGGPIINLVLKRNADLGFKSTIGSSISGIRQDHSFVNKPSETYLRVSPYFSPTYRSGKINLTGNFSMNQGNYFNEMKIDRLINGTKYASENLDQTDILFKNARIGADFYATDKLTTGMVFRIWDREADGFSNSITKVFNNSNNTPLNNFSTDNDGINNRDGLFLNYYIKNDFNKDKNHFLSFDVDYNKFNAYSMNALSIGNGEVASPRSKSAQEVTQPVDIYVYKLDYSMPLDSTSKLELGGKSSFSTVDNTLNFIRNNTIIQNQSNHFLYKENINAAYVKADKQFSKFDISAGLRMEQTVIDGSDKEVKVLSRNYTQFFPSASLSYKLNKDMAIQSSFAKRVNRPSFQQQNPASNFIDSLTYTRGNPQLRPETMNTSQLMFTYSGQPVLGISYNTTDDVIIENAPKIEGNKTFTIAENLARQKRVEIQLNFPIKIGKIIDGYGGNQAIYNSYDADYLGTPYKASKWNWLAYWQINVKLPADIKAEVGGFYMTKFLEEFLTIGNLGGLNFGFSKQFAKKKGRVSLNFNDVFYSQNTDARIDFADVNVGFISRELSRTIRLAVSYQFGNSKVKNADSRNSASESESSRVKID